MEKPEIVSAEVWQAARDDLLKAEKDATRAQDALAARRRRLPMVEVTADYTFAAADGTRSLPDLFEGREQLVTYQFMDVGPDRICGGCSAFTDSIPEHALPSLADQGVSWANVSNMPIAQITAAVAERGWRMPFVSSRGTSFADDCGADGGFVLSVFLRDGDHIYRTYTTTARGVDRLVYTNAILDLLPYGRRQDWEDSPPGWPQRPTYG